MSSRPTGRPREYIKSVLKQFADAKQALREARPTGRPGMRAHKTAMKQVH